MGKLRRRYIVCFQHWQGDLVNPLVESRPDQNAMSVVVRTIAVTGVQNAGYFGTIASITRAGDVQAAHLNVDVAALAVVTGDARGLRIEGTIEATGQLAAGQYFEGIRIELAALAGSVIPGNVHGIFITNYILIAPGGYHFIRLDENGSCTVQSAMRVAAGGTADISYLLWLVGNHTAWDSALNPSAVASGRIRCRVNNQDKFIQLYQP